MAVTEAFTVGIIKLAHATTPIYIGQMESSAVAPNVADLLLAGAGQADASFGAIGEVKPVCSFTTSQLKTVLDVCGIDGLQIDAAATYTDVEIYLQQLEEGGVRKSGSAHLMMAVNKGILIPRTINATQGPGAATIACDLLCTYDGTNDPIAVSSSVALPSVAAATEAFTLGPVDLNGTDVDGVQSVTVDFGITEINLSGDGDVYATFAAITDRRPRINLTTNKATFLTTTGISGTAVDVNNCTVFLRKVTEGGKRVADATEEHIAIAADEGVVYPDSTTYSQGDVVAQGFIVVPTYDGSNAVLAISTASAIT